MAPIPNSLVPRAPSAVAGKARDDGGAVAGALVLRHAKHPHASTSRALVLRREAYGSGEITSTTKKVSGQEKLKLLADEMMTTAVRSPFRIEELIRMANSQLRVHLDEISNLKDPMFFYHDILATINSRIESAPDKNGVRRRPPITDPQWLAQVIGSRVHNVYFLAGSWRIVRNLLVELQAMSLQDSNVHGQLQRNIRLRERYLVLFQVIVMLARIGQDRVAHVAAATPHYAPYFTQSIKTGKETMMEFDHSGQGNMRKLREAHASFIDSIMLEIALPNSEYPFYTLMSLLHDAVEECRKEEKRFSQALWNAVGDFSVTVQVMDVLEGPLLGEGGEDWIRTSASSSEYLEFLSVQEMSSKASKDTEPWTSCLSLLFDMTDKDKLDLLWSLINQSYKRASGGQNIDELWSLQADLNVVPQWSTSFQFGLHNDDDDDDVDAKALVLHKSRKKRNDYPEKERARISQGADDEDDDDEDDDDDDDYDDVPSLRSRSDSSEEEDRSEGGSESDFDSDEDEALQGDLRDALDAMVDIDLIDAEPAIIKQEKMSTNPFIRMFANFRERHFSTDPTLRASEKSRNPFKLRPAPTPSTSHPDVDPLPPLESAAPRTPKTPTKPKAKRKPRPSEELALQVPVAPQESRKPTMEEVQDEDHVQKSKKKKKKKKKKPTTTTSQDPLPSPIQQPTPPSSTPVSPQKNQKSPPAASKRPLSDANFSRTSLPLVTETAAQSARSYLQAKSLTIEKNKVKNRPGVSSIFRSDKDDKKLEKTEEKTKSFFGRIKFNLDKKTNELMSRLIGPSNVRAMKWTEFLKVMEAMQFTYNPSTAGSSVRFDPPNKKDPSIMFHKPHPDSTLYRNHLRNFGKKLKNLYGWNESHFGFKKDDDSDVSSDY